MSIIITAKRMMISLLVLKYLNGFFLHSETQRNHPATIKRIRSDSARTVLIHAVACEAAGNPFVKKAKVESSWPVFRTPEPSTQIGFKQFVVAGLADRRFVFADHFSP